MINYLLICLLKYEINIAYDGTGGWSMDYLKQIELT